MDPKPLPAAEVARKKAVDARAAHIPPRPPLVLRVGVTGHRPDPTKRPDANVEALRAIIRGVLRQIAESVAGVGATHAELFTVPEAPAGAGRSRLRLVSALAAGADQWTAKEAWALGYDLQYVLPFSREEYRRDFDGDEASAIAYDELLDKATAVLQLDGDLRPDTAGRRRSRSASYEAAGRVVLHQSDLLIAVWDGQEDQGRGGTGQIVHEALQRGIPVVWIHWSSGGHERLPEPGWSLLRETNDFSEPLDALTRQVRNLLVPAVHRSGAHAGGERDLRREYFHERLPSWNPVLGWWTLFRDLACLGVGPAVKLSNWLGAFRVRPLEAISEWRGEMGHPVPEGAADHASFDTIAQRSEETFYGPYAWADRLSVYYANVYRSSFVLNFLLSAGAVFFALLTVVAPPHGTIAIVGMVLELVLIVFILGLTSWGRHRRWHQRWIDYRTLAERFRLARFLMFLGGGGQQASLAAHLASYGDPTGTWMHWYYLAFERAAGLPAVKFDETYLCDCKRLWCDGLVDEQVKYHAAVLRRFTTMERRLHTIGVALFITTLLVCFVHLGFAAYAKRPVADAASTHAVARAGWLTFFAAFLPALGAALSAIRGQAELHRVAQRSSAMHERLTDLHLVLASTACRPDELNSVRLRENVQRIANLMIDEMLDWRVVFQDRPLALPA